MRLIPRRAASIAFALATALALGACEDDPPDPRFATPDATVRTLFTAYGVEDLTQAEIQQRMMTRGQFELRDEAAYRACFADFRGPEDEGLAGFVFGTLAAAKDELEIVPSRDVIHVFPDRAGRPDRSVVMRREEAGYKIVLRESVPRDVQRQLLDVHRRASEQARRHGSPE